MPMFVHFLSPVLRDDKAAVRDVIVDMLGSYSSLGFFVSGIWTYLLGLIIRSAKTSDELDSERTWL